MVNERTFEDILWKYPELIESGLTAKGRQVALYGRRIDLLFKDKHKRDLLVELKVGPIKDEHIGQLMSYEGMLLSADNPSIRVMLIGNRVPPNIGRALDHHGIAWKEITNSVIENFLKQKKDVDLLRFFDPSLYQISKKTIPAHTASSEIEVRLRSHKKEEEKEVGWKGRLVETMAKQVFAEIKSIDSNIIYDETDKGMSFSSIDGNPKKFLAIRCGSALIFRFYTRRDVERIYPQGEKKDKSNNRRVEIYKKLYPGDDLTEAINLTQKCYQLSQKI